jgi:hypothetical protein
MKTREEIVAWLADLERVIDQSVLVMNSSEARIEKLEEALRRIAAADGIGGPAMQAIARAALAPERDK